MRLIYPSKHIFYNFSTAMLLFAALLFSNSNINDPIARIGTLTGGKVDAEVFHSFKALNVTKGIEECKIISYEMTWVAKQEDPVMSMNYAAEFNNKSKELVAKAKSLDCYYFDNVKAKCPGDIEERNVNSLVFKIN